MSNCNDAELRDLEEVAAMCVGDVCFRVRKCDKPTVPCQPTEAQECPWKEFCPELAGKLSVTKTWVIVAPSCMYKSIACPFERAIKNLQNEGQQAWKAATGNGNCSDATSVVLPWCYPRISFTTEAHISQCEKAIGVHGRAPFIALIDQKNQSAFVQDATSYCGRSIDNAEDGKTVVPLCGVTKEDFCLICTDNIEKFTRLAALGEWPKAMLGEKPPLDDRFGPKSHLALLTRAYAATQSTFDRLVTGQLSRLSEVVQDATRRDNNQTSLRSEGPVLALAVLWGPQCPCCRPVLNALHHVIEILESEGFRQAHPDYVEVLGNQTVRLVALNAEKNDIPEELWADSEVHTLPTIVGFRHGIRVPHFRGVRSSRKLIKYIVHHLFQIQQYHTPAEDRVTPQMSPMLAAKPMPSGAVEPLELAESTGAAQSQNLLVVGSPQPMLTVDPFPLPRWGEVLVQALDTLDESTDDSLRKRSRIES